MEIGENGTVGQNVNPIVRKEDPDHVTILLQLIEEDIVLEKEEMLQIVLKICAQLMEIGEIGVPGPPVEIIVRKQDPDPVTILLEWIEEKIVLEIKRKVVVVVLARIYLANKIEL